jgi:hypothetical protein
MRNSMPRTNSAAPIAAQEPLLADAKRRRFLFTLGAGGAGAAVAVAAAIPGAASAQGVTAPSCDEDAAYRATAHVRDYYRTARV